MYLHVVPHGSFRRYVAMTKQRAMRLKPKQTYMPKTRHLEVARGVRQVLRYGPCPVHTCVNALDGFGIEKNLAAPPSKTIIGVGWRI